MDRHVTLILCCAFLYLIIVATIETFAIIYKINFEIMTNESYRENVIESLNYSKYNDDFKAVNVAWKKMLYYMRKKNISYLINVQDLAKNMIYTSYTLYLCVICLTQIIIPKWTIYTLLTKWSLSLKSAYDSWLTIHDYVI